MGKHGQPGFLLGQGRTFVEEVYECSRANGQAPPTSAHLPKGWLTSSPSLGGGASRAWAQEPTEFAQRVLLPQAPHPGPRQGRSLAGICWGNVGGMCVVGPGARGEKPRSWWAGGHSSRRGDPAAEGAIGGGLEALGPCMGNPLLPGGLGTPPPLDKSLSCSPGIHSRFHALRPPSEVKDTVAWGSPVCRWEEPAIWVKSLHIGSNAPPEPSPPPSPLWPPRLQQVYCLQSADQGADLGRPSLLQGCRPWGFPGGSKVKTLPANAGKASSIPGSRLLLYLVCQFLISFHTIKNIYLYLVVSY